MIEGCILGCQTLFKDRETVKAYGASSNQFLPSRLDNDIDHRIRCSLRTNIDVISKMQPLRAVQSDVRLTCAQLKAGKRQLKQGGHSSAILSSIVQYHIRVVHGIALTSLWIRRKELCNSRISVRCKLPQVSSEIELTEEFVQVVDLYAVGEDLCVYIPAGTASRAETTLAIDTDSEAVMIADLITIIM
jgi:hypothetical protein